MRQKNEILIGAPMSYQGAENASRCRIFGLSVGATVTRHGRGSREVALFERSLFAVLIVVLAAALGAGPVTAQEDLTRGKTPAQLFASDCADCHKSPRGLTSRSNINALASFLRVHYTASRESAAAIAGYLVALGNDPAARAPSRPPSSSRSRPASQEQGKSNQAAQPTAAKPADKPADKPDEDSPKPPESVPEAPAATSAPAPAGEPAPAAKPADPQ
jgi:hypothetical protein